MGKLFPPTQHLKAPLPMESRPSEKVIRSKEVQSLKASLSMLRSVDGKTISVNAAQSLKALTPMESRPSDKVIRSKELHRSKADMPMVRTVEGKITSFISSLHLKPVKALLPMDTTA